MTEGSLKKGVSNIYISHRTSKTRTLKHMKLKKKKKELSPKQV